MITLFCCFHSGYYCWIIFRSRSVSSLIPSGNFFLMCTSSSSLSSSASSLSVSRQRGDTESPRRKPIPLAERARQIGTALLIWICPRNQTKPHLFLPPYLAHPPPRSEIHLFVHFLVLFKVFEALILRTCSELSTPLIPPTFSPEQNPPHQPLGQIPDIKVGIEEPSVRYR